MTTAQDLEALLLFLRQTFLEKETEVILNDVNNNLQCPDTNWIPDNISTCSTSNPCQPSREPPAVPLSLDTPVSLAYRPHIQQQPHDLST
jgi:hypothetical protein